jgi:hypothetical protein
MLAPLLLADARLVVAAPRSFPAQSGFSDLKIKGHFLYAF